MSVRNADSNGNKPTVISTFAGCGGSSLGYKLAGFRELLAVEWDDNAVKTFRLNFPGVPVYHGDIAKLTGAECMKQAGIKAGELDVLDGSPPCQGFSTAGKRKFDDPRNSLFREFARLLRELQPRVFVMENVTGMIKGVMKQAYLVIIQTLRDCGYTCSGEVLNAMYFNVPQNRQRVIIVGVRKDLEIAPSHPKPQTRPLPVGKCFESVVSKTFAVQPKGASTIFPQIKQSRSAIQCCSRASLAQYVPRMVNNKRYTFNRICVRLNPAKPAGTITKTFIPYSEPFLHPHDDRYPSIQELQRIASFPDNFVFVGTFKKQWARIGDSVPPNLMRAIAEHIKDNILHDSMIPIEK